MFCCRTLGIQYAAVHVFRRLSGACLEQNTRQYNNTMLQTTNTMSWSKGGELWNEDKTVQVFLLEFFSGFYCLIFVGCVIKTGLKYLKAQY